jgi:glyoxylate/hydroxypyruvate reductase
MAILFVAPGRDATPWIDAFASADPGIELRIWPARGDPASIEAAILWTGARGALQGLPNLRFVSSLGAGVEHILEDESVPPDVSIVRVVETRLTEGMTHFCVYATLRLHRRFDLYERQQRERVWLRHSQIPTADRRVGVMGLGALGGAVARALAGLGFPVAAWTRQPRSMPGIKRFHGHAQFHSFLGQTDILICLLPLTRETRGILDAAAFGALPKGAMLVNAARGGHVVEKDLLASLDADHLAAAVLDVFAPEPLAANSALWSHPKVTVTPHVASLSDPQGIATEILENLARARRGEPLLNLVDRARGY